MLPILNSRIRGDVAHPPVILLHGLFGSNDNLGRVATALSEEFCTHSLDLRNHGKSFHSDDMSYELMAQDVKRYLEEKNLSGVRIVGHSMGGKVAMKLALTYPDLVDKIVVADISPVKYPPHHSEIIKGLVSLNESSLSSREEANRMMSEYVDEPGVRQFLLKNLSYDAERKLRLKLNLPAIVDNYENIMAGQDIQFDQQAFLGRVLFIAGGDSDYIQKDHSDHIQKIFPNAQLKTIPGASHWLHAEKTDLFNGICIRFLRQ